MTNKGKTTKKYEYCNHHHKLTKQHKIVDFGDGKFVANKTAIPLLKALNERGLKTRTHHVDETGGFISILLDNATIEVYKVFERDADRTKYNGKYEVLLQWENKTKKPSKKKVDNFLNKLYLNL